MPVVARDGGGPERGAVQSREPAVRAAHIEKCCKGWTSARGRQRGVWAAVARFHRAAALVCPKMNSADFQLNKIFKWS
jgi:hypothetical protein